MMDNWANFSVFSSSSLERELPLGYMTWQFRDASVALADTLYGQSGVFGPPAR